MKTICSLAARQTVMREVGHGLHAQRPQKLLLGVAQPAEKHQQLAMHVRPFHRDGAAVVGHPGKVRQRFGRLPRLAGRLAGNQ